MFYLFILPSLLLPTGARRGVDSVAAGGKAEVGKAGKEGAG